MKTVIYYFTGTGNSLAIARDLAAELGGADLVPIVKAITEKPVEGYDAIGIVYPVYMFGLPLIVAKFLRYFSPRKDSYVFCVANYGGMQGRANPQVARILAGRGIALAAAYGITMPGNYTPLYGAIAPAEQKAMFDKAKEKVKKIAADVSDRKAGIMEHERGLAGLLGLVIHIALYHIGSMMVPTEDKKFWVTEKCIHCGLCAKVCPVCNIAMEDGRPTWLHHCQNCMACLQWCPSEAIQFQKITVGRKRYHHPSCKAADIEAQKK